MSEALGERVDKAWATVADIVLGEPIHGEVLSRNYRLAMQRLLWAYADAPPLSHGVDSFLLSDIVSYAMAVIATMARRTHYIAEEHDKAIIRHAQHARWRNLYRLAKKSGQAKGKTGDR